MKVECSCHAFDEQMRQEGNPELACAASSGCWKEWEIETDEQTAVFCGDPVCPPCYEMIKQTLAELKRKGVTVEIRYQ
jgi:hypothetical protein